MNGKLHIPTEQYGFCEVEFTDYSAAQASQLYTEVSKAFQAKPINELPTKEFNAALDEFLLSNTLTNGTEVYEKMSPAQQNCFQEVKKSLKRLSARENKGTE